jgi:hypothetical protein
MRLGRGLESANLMPFCGSVLLFVITSDEKYCILRNCVIYFHRLSEIANSLGSERVNICQRKRTGEREDVH